MATGTNPDLRWMAMEDQPHPGTVRDRSRSPGGRTRPESEAAEPQLTPTDTKHRKEPSSTSLSLSSTEDLVRKLMSEIDSLRTEIRTRTPVPAPIGIAPAPQIKLKDVVATIPVFNGHNMPMLHFARSCKRALAMLPAPMPQGAEANLVRAVKAKLQGHAYLAVEDERADTMSDLLDTLKAALSPNRSTNYYRGELGNLFKKPNEHVLDYIARTKDLRQAIMDNESRDLGGDFDRRALARLDAEVVEHFVDGLPPHLRFPLQMADCKTLTDTCHALMRIHHLPHQERDALRHGVGGSAPGLPRRVGEPAATGDHAGWRNHTRPQVTMPIQSEERRPAVTCNYCKQTGHIKYDCELRRIRNEAQATGNSTGGLNGPSAAQTAPVEPRAPPQQGQLYTSFNAPRAPGPQPSTSGLRTQ